MGSGPVVSSHGGRQAPARRDRPARRHADRRRWHAESGAAHRAADRRGAAGPGAAAPAPGRAGARWHGGGAAGLRRDAAAAHGGEDHACEHLRAHDAGPRVPARGAGDRPARPPEHRADPRARARRDGPALFHDEAGRGPEPQGADRRSPDRRPRSPVQPPRDLRQDLRCPRLRPRARGPALRHQVGQRDGRRVRAGLPDGLGRGAAAAAAPRGRHAQVGA